MTSKLQRKIMSVSETAACAAVEGALDAVLFVRKRKKKKQKVSLSKGSRCCVCLLFGDARMRMRIRDVQTMPGLEGRGGEGGGGGGREMGDGERGSLLGIFFFVFLFGWIEN